MTIVLCIMSSKTPHNKAFNHEYFPGIPAFFSEIKFYTLFSENLKNPSLLDTSSLFCHQTSEFLYKNILSMLVFLQCFPMPYSLCPTYLSVQYLVCLHSHDLCLLSTYSYFVFFAFPIKSFQNLSPPILLTKTMIYSLIYHSYTYIHSSPAISEIPNYLLKT